MPFFDSYSFVFFLIILLSLMFLWIGSMRQVRDRLWFRTITSALRINHLLNKVAVFRVLVRSFWICCRPTPENPLPRSIMGRLLVYLIKFRQILHIYSVLYGPRPKKKVSVSKKAVPDNKKSKDP